MSYKFSRRSLSRLEGVNPYLVEIFKEAIDRCPIDFGIPEDGGLRTVKRQKELYAQGRTKPGKKITKADGVRKKSRHQSGNAIDVYAYINGKASWEDIHLAMIAGCIISTAHEMGFEVTWGGSFGSNNWDGWDKAHFELKE